MKKSDIIQQAILELVGAATDGVNPSANLQKRFGVTREALSRHFKILTTQKKITPQGYGKGRTYKPGPHFNLSQSIYRNTFAVNDLATQGEDLIFNNEIAPTIESKVPPQVVKKLRYTITELLNNVIDHSQASKATVTIELSSGAVDLNIEDNGRGVFDSLRNYFQLKDCFEAAGELAKGRRTTSPKTHAGEGLFFSARIADYFSISANGVRYIYIDTQDDWSIGAAEDVKAGTHIHCRINLNSEKTTKSVFDRYTDDYSFELNSPRLVSPYAISLPPGDLISRSEAKKILAGAELFRSIIMDFKNVDTIGQGFADEVFRVFQNLHPEIKIGTKNANSFIERMIEYVKR